MRSRYQNLAPIDLRWIPTRSYQRNSFMIILLWQINLNSRSTFQLFLALSNESCGIPQWMQFAQSSSLTLHQTFLSWSGPCYRYFPLGWLSKESYWTHLPWISEFLKTGQTEQSWHEVIGCWTIAGWWTEWRTGGLSGLGVCLANGPAVWLAEEELLFTTGKRGYWSHHPWSTGTERVTRAEVKCNYNVLSLFPCFPRLLFLFNTPSPPRLPWASVKGSFMDLRERGAVKVQHLKNTQGKTVKITTESFYPASEHKGAVIYLWWHWCGNVSTAYVMTQVHTGKRYSESRTWFSVYNILYHCTHII